jgi:hypothetical protein
MSLQLDSTQTWNAEEIRDLILFAQSVREENEELKAKLIAMDAYVKNADTKIKRLTMLLKQYIDI